ncbi:MAG: prepilin-type N-terminal cleavage/methylation domain-containing protein [Gammaproteobacteria bacterium]|nr:prepilin-type N-terminal cleavage/methylation domain-containing protein [Gammaproteobacteria bacterium]
MTTKGFTLVEMLLVTAIAAVLITLGIRHYRFYQQQQHIASLTTKIHTLQWALNRYYHQQGCLRDGTFRGNLQPDIIRDLLYDVNTGMQGSFVRDDWVNSYQASIVDTTRETYLEQPIYKLKLTITLNSGLSDTQVTWLSQKLNANQLQGRELIWTVLPRNTVSEPGNSLWVMSASNEQFRQSEQARSKNIINLTDAHSYCAH